MPIYEYQCEACQHKLERLQKISDEPLKVCPECEQPALNKLVSAAAFRLKGSGWYETDFKTGSKKNVSGADKKPDSGSSDAAKSGTESGAKKEAKKAGGESTGSKAATS